MNHHGLDRSLRHNRRPDGRCNERWQAGLLGLKRHRCRTLEALLATVAIKPSALAWRARFTRLLVTRLKLAGFAGLRVAGLMLSRLMLARLLIPRLILSWLTRLARLELALFAGLRVRTAESLIARLIFALFAGLEIPVVTLWAWAALVALIARLIGLLALLIVA